MKDLGERMSRVIQVTPQIAIPLSELTFAFTRSQGPGGQNVNKLSTRVELFFEVRNSPSLDENQKQQVFSALKSRIDTDGILHIAVQDSRSQWQNRVGAIQRFSELMSRALKNRRKRIPTKVSFSTKQKARVKKKLQSEKKRVRRKVDRDEM